jgi:hypothetical protein
MRSTQEWLTDRGMTTCASHMSPPSVRTLGGLAWSRHHIPPFIRRQYEDTSRNQQRRSTAHPRCLPSVDQALCSLTGHSSSRRIASLHLACPTLNAIIGRLHASPLYRPHLQSRPGKPRLSRLTNEMAYLPILYHDED